MMPTTQGNGTLRALRRVALRRDGAGLTDGELLEHYVSERDEGAFEALVRRHGPMVWGVCRRILRNAADAEDAFQATFLVLVRKAASVVPRGMIGNWLYGVARQTAHKARAMDTKRRTKERRAGLASAREAAPDWRRLHALLDEELGRLPEKYRVPVVLCDLEGRTIRETARQLGWPQGTVAGRLARARAMLAKRLARHGLGLSGAVLAAGLSPDAAAAVPAPLMVSTVKAVTLVAAGRAAVPEVVSAKAAALTEGVVKTMFLNKLKIVTAVCTFVAAVLVAGIGLSAILGPPARAQEAKAPAARDKSKADQPAPLKGASARELVERLTWTLANVDTEKGTIDVDDNPHGEREGVVQPLGTRIVAKPNEATVTGLTLYDLVVAPSAKITIDGQDAKLADLKDGNRLTLTLAPDRFAVTKIKAETKSATGAFWPECSLKQVDTKARTIDVTLQVSEKEKLDVKGLALRENAKTYSLQLTKFADGFVPRFVDAALDALAPGTLTALEFRADKDKGLLISEVRVGN